MTRRFTASRWLGSLATVAGMVAVCTGGLLAAAGSAAVWVTQVGVPAQAYVDVRQGDAVATVSARLHDLGLTMSPGVLQWYWRLRGGPSLHPGRYSLSDITTVDHAYERLATGGPMTVRVTIPEGWTVRKMAARFQDEAGIPQESFMDAALDRNGASLEGYLFPDTYDVVYAGDPSEIIARMRARFDEVLPAGFDTAAQRHELTTFQLVIAASVIEREARFDDDRPLIASVLFNRLEIGMLLQMDATLEYVLASHEGFFSYEQLKYDSPYNTYVYPGLPPGPICSPGLASLAAAVEAPTSPYYYFLAKPDGHCVFARTFAEHQRNMRLYLPGGN
jgi:UPF0755 protein